MKPTLFAVAFLVFAGLAGAAPQPAHAAILPACDQTIYKIQKNNTLLSAEDCKKTDGDLCILTPERYDQIFNTEQERKENPPEVTTETACGFNDFIQLFINLSTFGLGILGALALLFMIWGGFTLLTSGGNQEKVRAGKQTMWGAFFGVVIVLTAWVFVGSVVSIFSGSGYSLFPGTKYERSFFGNRCPSYKACDINNLHETCRDDTRQNQNGVSKAQEILGSIGCYEDQVDGCFGPKTRNAVLTFQRVNNDDLTADGVIDPQTWDALKNAAAGTPGTAACRQYPSDAQVAITSSGFVPATTRLSVRSSTGATVTFTNKLPAPHAIELTRVPIPAAPINTLLLQPAGNAGDTKQVTLYVPGAYEFRDPSLGQTGTIEVSAS